MTGVNWDKPTLGDAPVQMEYRELMERTMRALDAMFNGEAKGNARKTGVIVLTFPFNNHQGRCNFMSNGANRDDVVVLLKEMIARFEGQPEIKGNA